MQSVGRAVTPPSRSTAGPIAPIGSPCTPPAESETTVRLELYDLDESQALKILSLLCPTAS